MQNGYVESLNGRMRDELLNESLFFGIGHARSAVAALVADYNTERRRHSSHGYATPADFARTIAATGPDAVTDDSSASAPVAHHTPHVRSGRGSKRRWMKHQWQVRASLSR